MLREGHPLLRQAIRFAMLPYCFVRGVNWRQCPKSPLAVAGDLLYSFFVLRTYPDHYGPCQLWRKPRSEWAQYFGSNYNPFQRGRLRRTVHPYFLERALQDKQVADGLCERMGIPVPRTLGILLPGEPSDSALDAIFGNTTSNRLIVKPVDGHAGLGIVMAHREPNSVRIQLRDRSIDARDFRPESRCIVQEVLQQNEDLNRIASGSINTLRLLTMLDVNDQFLVIGASMRFGVGAAFVDNWSAGGVAVGVDHETGRLLPTGFDKLGNPYEAHPQSGVRFGSLPLPGWNDALLLGERVQRAFPFFRLLGMDLAFTPDGVVLIEINNDADLLFQEQTSGPLLANRRTWEAFRSYDLLYNRHQRELYR